MSASDRDLRLSNEPFVRSVNPDKPDKAPVRGWKRYMTDESGVEYQFWTTDNDGRELLAAVTTSAADAGILWDGIIRARASVEWREARHGEYKGKLVRGWDGDAAPADRLYHREADV